MLFELLVIEVVKHGLGERKPGGHRFEITHMTFFVELIPKTSFETFYQKVFKKHFFEAFNRTFE
jgi:hypothetical protein